MCPMTAARFALLQGFFDVHCGTPGRIPDCSACGHLSRTPTGNRVCIHPENPENKTRPRQASVALPAVVMMLMLSLLILASGCTSKLYPSGFFTELADGKHYDCTPEAIQKIPNTISEQEAIAIIEYCKSNPMQDFTRNKYGEHRDPKTGAWTQ